MLISASDRARPENPLWGALEDIQPDAVILDARMLAYFWEAPQNETKWRQVEAWLEEVRMRLAAVIDDPTYGPMQIYLKEE